MGIETPNQPGALVAADAPENTVFADFSENPEILRAQHSTALTLDGISVPWGSYVIFLSSTPVLKYQIAAIDTGSFRSL